MNKSQLKLQFENSFIHKSKKYYKKYLDTQETYQFKELFEIVYNNIPVFFSKNKKAQNAFLLSRETRVNNFLSYFLTTLENFKKNVDLIKIQNLSYIQLDENSVIENKASLDINAFSSNLIDLYAQTEFASEVFSELTKEELSQSEEDNIYPIPFFKGWNTQEDPKVRDSHRKANKQRVLVTNFFIVGGYSLKRPADYSSNAPIKELAKCRCFSTYHLTP